MLMRELRLLPAVILATGALLTLKVVGFATGEPFQAGPKMAQAQESMNAPPIPLSLDEALKMPGRVDKDGDPLFTASAPAKKEEPKKEEEPKAPVAPPPKVLEAPPPQLSPAERALIERLQERRKDSDVRLKELEDRELLLKAAEKRIDQKAQELKDLEAKINAAVQKRDEDEVKRMRGVVSMYETMRPKDAARIFDDLDLPVLLDVAVMMKPAKLADVLAQMKAETAKRLTVELARNPNKPQAQASAPSELPKIEGRPVR